MLNRSRISVIIPVYNSEVYLAEALNSVLNQRRQPDEVIVVDDGSTDNSRNTAHQFGGSIRYEYHPVNHGAATARNRGVELAQGEFLAFLDADDLWVEEKLALQVQAFNDNPDLDMVSGHVQQFHSPELHESIKQRIKIPQEVIRGQHVGAMLIRRDAFEKVGSFNSELKLAEFIEWQARAMELGLKEFILPEIVMKRRLHKSSQGTYNRKHRIEYARVLKAALDRRRNATNRG
jgi:glycosyltransferase involved in cell wall biosynthesis